MKRSHSLVLVVTVAITFAVWLFTAARQERVVNVLTWDFYLGSRSLQDFEERFGIKVNVTIYASNEDLYARLQARPSSYDVAFPSDYMINRLREEGGLARLDKSKLPNAVNIDPGYRANYYDSSEEYSVPFLFGTTGFAVDVKANKIAPEDLSWRAIAASGLDRRVAVIDDPRFVLGSALLELGKDPNTRLEEDLESAVALLRSARPAIRAFTPDTGKDLLLRREVDIAYAWNGDVLQVQAERPEVRYVIPASGSLRFQDGMVIPSRSQNVTEAHLLINFLLDPEISAAITNERFYGNTNKAAARFILPEVLRNTASFPTSEQFRGLHWIRHFQGSDDLYQKYWEAVKR